MQKTIVVSGPVIVENNKVLLDKSGEDNFWKFCGGRVKDGEALLETAARRAKEEVGVDLKILDEEPFILFTRKETEDGTIDVILVHFLAERIGEIDLGTDTKECDLFSIDDLPEDLGPNIVPALQYFELL